MGNQMMALNISEKHKEAFLKIKELSNSNKLLEDLKKEMIENMTPEELTQLKEHYEDPLIVREMDRSSFYQTPEGQKNLMQAMQKFQDPESGDESFISKEKWEAIKKNGEASGESKRMIKTMKKFVGPLVEFSNKGS